MKKNYFLIIIVLGFFSCKKEKSETVAGPEEVDVYVAGFVSDHPYLIRCNSGYDEHPTYWKNGSPVQLDYGDYRGDNNNKSARAIAIAVSGNNVYVAGYGTWFSLYQRAITIWSVLEKRYSCGSGRNELI